MGIRGLRVVRFRGRYFVTLVQTDGHLQGLGKDIVADIPEDADKLKEWLNTQRSHYAALTEKLENVHLLVTPQCMEAFVQEREHYEQHRGDANPPLTKPEPSWKELETQDLPSAFCDVFQNLYIEFTYIVDLDEEVFIVNNWIYFELSNIPRDRWTEGFEFLADGRSSFDFETCPEAYTAEDFEGPDYEPVVVKQDELLLFHQRCHVQVVNPIHGSNVSCYSAPPDLICLATLTELVTQYRMQIITLVPSWSHDSYEFRELAFAILSLATGRCSFVSLDDYHGEKRSAKPDGFFVAKRHDQQPMLLPSFGSGCHAPDQAPGSAPCETLYWMENVLVCLVPDCRLEEQTDLALLRAIQFASKTDTHCFRGVLFSITRVVFFDVTPDKSGTTRVRRTQPVDVFESEVLECTALEDEPVGDELFAKLSRQYRGYLTLQRFFRTTTAQAFELTFSNGSFPVEVYANVISHLSTDSTYSACREVNHTFRALCQDRFSFSSNKLELVKMYPTKHTSNSTPQGPHGPYKLNKLEPFNFRSVRSGRVIQSKLKGESSLYTAERHNMHSFYPVIGGHDRPSVMTAIEFDLHLPDFS